MPVHAHAHVGLVYIFTQVRVMRECEEEPSLQQSRLVFSDVTVFHVPSGDMGKGRYACVCERYACMCVWPSACTCHVCRYRIYTCT